MFIKIAMLYGLIALGYFAKKKFALNPKKVSYGLLYFILPSFIVSKLALSDLVPTDLTKPLLAFFAAVLVSIGCYALFSLLYKKEDNKNMKYLAAGAIGNANTGYFGIPIALLVFPEKLAILYILANFGVTLFQLTLGYYFYARSSATFSDSIVLLIKFPPFWALCIGLGINFSNILLPEIIHIFLSSITDITTILFTIGGMGLIGVGLAEVKLKDINIDTTKVMLWSNALCYILWPISAMIIIYLDGYIFHWLAEGQEKILWLMALCPIGANAVLYSNNFDLYPKQAVLMVFSSTLLALPVLGIGAITILQ